MEYLKHEQMYRLKKGLESNTDLEFTVFKATHILINIVGEIKGIVGLADVEMVETITNELFHFDFTENFEAIFLDDGCDCEVCSEEKEEKNNTCECGLCRREF